MDYIKLFGEHSLYEDYVYENGILRPNVSYCIFENEVHYNPIMIEKSVTLTLNVVNDTEMTRIYNYSENYILAVNYFEKVIIDDSEVSTIELDNNSGKYQLSNGIHIVKFIMKEDTIYEWTFGGNSLTTDVIISDGIIRIENNAFDSCPNIVNVEIGKNVRYLGDSSFYFDEPTSNTVTVTIHSLIPPLTGNYQYDREYDEEGDVYPFGCCRMGHPTIFVHDECLENYMTHMYWSKYEEQLCSIENGCIEHEQL